VPLDNVKALQSLMCNHELHDLEFHLQRALNASTLYNI
jgi:hypothetical protein